MTLKVKFSRRLLMLGGLQAGLFLVLAGRLQFLQVARSDVYATLAEANRVNISQISHCAGVSLTAAANYWPIMITISNPNGARTGRRYGCDAK